MVETKGLKHPYLWFPPVFNSSACSCCGGAVCIIGKTHKLHNKYFAYCFIPYHISSTPQAFWFLSARCSQENFVKCSCSQK